jgi:hypothetical protein
MSDPTTRRSKPEARLRTPEPSLADAKPVDWRDMSTAPKDGRPLWLRGEGHVDECVWRATRMFKDGAWVPTGFWTRVTGNPRPLNFDPVNWYREDRTLA